MSVNAGVASLQASLGETRVPNKFRSRFTYVAITLAMQRHPHQRELTSRLLAEMCGPVLSVKDIEDGMDMTINDLADLVIDNPLASEVSCMRRQ